MTYARFLMLAALVLLPLQGRAEIETDIIRIEVLDGGVTAKGSHMAGLKLTLKPGWKTYWRSPGDAGIPPSFDWSGSKNLKAVAITWPAPQAFEQSGMRSIGYKDHVVLPLTLTPTTAGADIRLRGSVELGICKDICVPARLSFDQDLRTDSPRNGDIAAALAARPYSAKEAKVSATLCRLSPTRDGMEIEARITMPSAGGTELAIIEPGNPMIWASEADTRREGQILTARAELIHTEGGTLALDRSKIRLTVLGDRYAVDIRGCQPG